MKERAPVIAAIDVGTNSFHLVMASVDKKGIMTPITRDKHMVRLGSGSTDMKYITEDAMTRGVNTLTEFAKLAASEKAHIRAIATSAVREASNKQEFIKRVYDEAGIELEVVSGNEEARLIYIGTIHALPLYRKKTFVIDIGGGSTETIIGLEGKVLTTNSEKIGAIRMTRRFFPDGITDKKSIAKCTEYIRGEWFPKLKKHKNEKFEIAVGTSGTIQTIAKIALEMNSVSAPAVLNGYTVYKDDILKAVKLIKNKETPEKREKIKGMDAKRADIITGGAIILEQAIEYLGIEKLLISPYALREGIVFDTLRQIKAASEFPHLSHLRRDTIYRLVDKYEINRSHAENVKDMSLRIFDLLKNEHKLSGYYREILESAALLHDVGYHISLEKHHKHSYYIITHCDMPGFTNDEAQLIANVARYHRKSHPKTKHKNYSQLNKEKKNAVRILGGILRIAEGLDRRHYQLINDICLKGHENGDIVFRLSTNGAAEADLELWGANRRVDMLQDVLIKNINFELS